MVSPPVGVHLSACGGCGGFMVYTTATFIFMKFTVEYGNVDLWYGTSKDDRSLLVTGKTRDECITNIVKGLKALEEARRISPKE